MNLLVIGGSGFIGYEIFQQSKDSDWKWSFTYNSNKINDRFLHLDALNKRQLANVINTVSPDVIVVTAAFPNVNQCEQFQEKSEKYNVNIIKNILELYSGKIVFLSTDYVFNGHSGPYSEQDIPDPINIYGKHKLIAEDLIKNNCENYLIIRTTGVYGFDLNRKNFLYRVIDTLSKRNKLFLPDDLYSNATYVKDLAKIMISLIKSDANGVFNVVGSEYLSRYELGILFSEMLNLESSLILPSKYNDLNLPVKRPLKGGLNPKKVLSMGYETTTIFDAINEVKDKL